MATALGPKTRAALLRSFGTYALIFAIGISLVLLQNSALQALGLGLIFPGGGFALWAAGDGWHFAVHIGLALAAFATFIVGLFLWFATGNALAPPAIWFSTAIAAALMQHSQTWQGAKFVVPFLALATLAAILAIYFLRIGLGSRHLKSKAARINAARSELDISRTTFAAPDELSLNDLHLMRTLYDRALQPLTQFEGFNHLDQYQTAALRYQLNLAGYALAMFQHTHAPAFHGYLNQAQHNLVVKNLDYRIWKFWSKENAWGNLDRNPNPCGRDNIMFTGFLATQIAMFHASSGNQPFGKSGALPFQHPDGRVFNHDANTMTQALLNNYSRAPLGLMACEPNWVYPLCNTIGAAALKHFAPEKWHGLEAEFQHALNTEFRDPGGQFVPCRSAYTGFALPTIGGAVGQAFPCFFLNATLPELAEQHWLANRSGMFKNGTLMRHSFWPVDVGNYGFSRASSLMASAAAANELGDTEIAKALFEQMELECPSLLRDGVRHRPAASFWAHSAEILARCTTRNALQSLLSKNKNTGPKLAHLAYPDVLVASAHNSKSGLTCVLYGQGHTTIGLADLQPLQTYNVLQLEKYITADANGEAQFDIHLNGRMKLHFEKRN